MIPLPTKQNKPWYDKAKCKTLSGKYVKIFYSRDKKDIKRAKQLCSWCDCRIECYDRAVANKEPGGIWGGVEFDATGPILDTDRVVPVSSTIYYPVSVPVNIVNHRRELVDETKSRSLLPEAFEAYLEEKD